MVLDHRAGVAREVGAAAHEPGHLVDQCLEAGAAGLAGGDLVAGRPRRQGVLPAGQPSEVDGRLVGLAVAVPRGQPLLPRLAGLAAPASGGPVEVEHVVGHPERLVGRQAQDLLGGPHLVVAQRVAVGVGGVGEVGGGPPDVAAQDQQRRGLVVGRGPPQRGLEPVDVVRHLAELVDVPPVALEALDHVVGQRELGLAVDADVVVVVDVDEPTEPQVAGEGGGLVADALHQVAVAADHVGVVVAHLGAEPGPEPALGHAQAHGVGEPLAQRPGGDLDSRGVVDLGVPRGLRAPLPEVAQVVEGQPVTREVEHRVEQDRGVPGREDEAVAVGPVGRLGVVVHDPRPQDVGQRSQRHGGAGVAVLRGLGTVHGQPADHVDGALLEVGIRGHAPATLVGVGNAPDPARSLFAGCSPVRITRRGRARCWR